MKRFIYLTLVGILALSVLAGCSASTDGSTASKGGTVTITFTQEPDNLNPLYSSMFFTQILREFYLKGLWSFDENNNPVPDLAKEVPSRENGGISEDNKTITVHLREDVKWSDGVPLTAEDFVFTYQMVMAEGNIVQSRYPYDEYVSAVEALDEHTVVIRFSEPFAPWITTIFNNAGLYPMVMPKHILQPVFDAEGSIDGAEWNRNPTVGLGPFVLKEWESGSHLIFEANPEWITPPNVEQIFIRIVPDDAAQEAAIIAGDTDIGVFLSSDRISTIEAGGTVNVVAVASGYNEAIFLNINPETAHPAMLDVRVREALALAIDRFTIVNTMLDPEINPVSATFWDTTPPFADPSLKPYTYDVERAKQLLDEAGWKDNDGDSIRDKDGVKLELRYVTNERELRANVQAVVQQQLSLAGIAVKLIPYSSDIYWNGYGDGGPLALGDYDLSQYSNNPAYPDPEASINWLCREIANADNPEGLNWQGYCNPELDTLLDAQATEMDLNARIQLYYELSQILYKDVVFIGMWKDPDLWSIRTALKGVKLSGATAFWNCADWYLEETQ